MRDDLVVVVASRKCYCNDRSTGSSVSPDDNPDGRWTWSATFSLLTDAREYAERRHRGDDVAVWINRNGTFVIHSSFTIHQ